MYTHKNFKTKKALKEAVAAGDQVTVYQPNGDLYGKGEEWSRQFTGHCVIEGPHYPEPHRWYASVDVENGVITKVKA